MQSGDGIIGKLLMNKSSGENFDTTLVNLKNSLAQLEIFIKKHRTAGCWVMIDQINSSRGMRVLFGLAATVIIIAGIYLAQSVVVLFLLSFFLALLGTPLVLWLKKKRVPS